MMRRLIRDEGILCGGSSGSAVSCALLAAKELFPNRSAASKPRVIILLADSVRNYMTKALSDDWMLDHGFVDGNIIKPKQYQTWWSTRYVHELHISTPLTITSNVSCKDAIVLLKREGFDMVPVLDDFGDILGVVTEGNMTSRILAGRCEPNTTIAEAGVLYQTFHKFTMQDTLGSVARCLDHDPFVIIVTEQRCFTFKKKRTRKLSKGSENDSASVETDNTAPTTVDTSTEPQTMAEMETRVVVSGIVSRIDLLDFISSGGNGLAPPSVQAEDHA